mmetsp:Transcript_9878/g.14863  ORF Transcript_9878/g.14863 Transcript_9878/m.14863 type:complete len:250 (+) Transcript_9878:88-837(+)|eukprot:CAMPEP_0167745552 /NCGR_PEP_ID=MMETSP0110_2-20121227/3213_1 /TAXON_ID=629695 /ORGANISM="Gymnochlora sp., Strain CCMP2014" /LENGTH=249 /DNA_ID=CAMNT_0007630203 /DNA_START=29 /DNA_END=778 /DNA_ORIENTATION=-
MGSLAQAWRILCVATCVMARCAYKGDATRRSTIKSLNLAAAILGTKMALGANEIASAAGVTYGEDITLPSIDRDFAPDETVQADLAWEQYRMKSKSGGLNQPIPTKTNLPASQYLSIIYTYKQESFDTLKNFLVRAADKGTISGVQNELRRMDTYLIQDAFNDVRQSMYYLPLAVAQKNSALGFNLQRRYDVVLNNLISLDQEINFLSYGRSDISDEDILAVTQALKDLEKSTDQYTEYATNIVAQLRR